MLIVFESVCMGNGKWKLSSFFFFLSMPKQAHASWQHGLGWMLEGEHNDDQRMDSRRPHRHQPEIQQKFQAFVVSILLTDAREFNNVF